MEHLIGEADASAHTLVPLFNSKTAFKSFYKQSMAPPSKTGAVANIECVRMYKWLGTNIFSVWHCVSNGADAFSGRQSMTSGNVC